MRGAELGRRMWLAIDSLQITARSARSGWTLPSGYTVAPSLDGFGNFVDRGEILAVEAVRGTIAPPYSIDRATPRLPHQPVCSKTYACLGKEMETAVSELQASQRRQQLRFFVEVAGEDRKQPIAGVEKVE